METRYEEERPDVADFTVTRYTATGDAGLRPCTDRAVAFVRSYREIWGDEALVGMSLYAETSRCPSYLENLIADVRDAGFSVRKGNAS